MDNITEARPLDTESGWETIVNANAANRSVARERVAARKLERKIKKLQLSVSVMAGTAFAFVILGATGAVAGWLATFASIVCLMAGCLQLGCYFEAKRK